MKSSEANLPIVFDRKFRPWNYSIGHSTLELRSLDFDPAGDVISVTFVGVIAMKLKTQSEFAKLTIASASDYQAEEILKLSEIDDPEFLRSVHWLALKSDGEDSLVACRRFSVWSHPYGWDRTSAGPSESSFEIYKA